MNIIGHAPNTARPTTTAHRVEERTIDVHAAPDSDGLVNTTLTSRDIHTAADRAGGMRVFDTLLGLDPDKYRSGSGHRLVVVAVDGGDR